ncbi:MAG: iron ABC transporter permease [Pseudomonadota bacterium]
MKQLRVKSVAWVAILATLVLFSTIYGTTAIPISDATEAIFLGLGISEGEMSAYHRIVFDLRLPRALSAAVIGAGLGVVGVVLQTTTRNDLADPFLFGLSSGAATGAVFVITVTGDILGFWTLPLAAFCGGLLAAGIVLVLVHGLRTSAPEKLILAGLAVSFLFSAITNYLIFSGDNRAAHSVIFWMLGGLGLARWETLGMVCAGLLLILVHALYHHRELDASLAGDQTAESLGVSVRKLRFSMFFAAAFATAIFVSVAGVIGFVGLMVPHIARGLSGPLHGQLLLIATIVGAILLVGSDILSRLLLAPQELPVGIVTTSIGSVFVFMLLFSMARKRL